MGNRKGNLSDEQRKARDQLIERVTELTREGKTAKEIGEIISTRQKTYTRNAVLSMWRRYNITTGEGLNRNKPRGAASPYHQIEEKWYSSPKTIAKKAGKSLPKREYAPKFNPRVLEPIDAPQIKGLPPGARPWITRRFGECAWPTVRDGETYSCCAPVATRKDGSEMQYCVEHVKVMYVKPMTPSKTEAVRLYGSRRRAA